MISPFRTGTRHGGTHHDHPGPPQQKADVPEDALPFRHCLVDVMQPEDLVIDNALGQIEDAPSEQDRSDTLTTRPPYLAAARPSPQQIKPCEHENVGAAVKEAIPCRVEADVVDGIERIPAA